MPAGRHAGPQLLMVIDRTLTVNRPLSPVFNGVQQGQVAAHDPLEGGHIGRVLRHLLGQLLLPLSQVSPSLRDLIRQRVEQGLGHCLADRQRDPLP